MCKIPMRKGGNYHLDCGGIKMKAFSFMNRLPTLNKKNKDKTIKEMHKNRCDVSFGKK